jgi:hypothetical protein
MSVRLPLRWPLAQAYDKRSEAWKEQLRAWMERERLKRIGRDAVAMRGTAPLQARRQHACGPPSRAVC